MTPVRAAIWCRRALAQANRSARPKRRRLSRTARSIGVSASPVHERLHLLQGKLAIFVAVQQDLAAFIHLCGAGPASAFVHRGFQMMAGERCGDHLVAAYLAKVNAMKRQFLRLAANGRN